MSALSDNCKRLVELREQITTLKLEESELIESIAANMEGNTYEVPGVGVFERHKKSSRKAWKHEELQSTLIRKIRNGEIPKLTNDDGEIVDEDDVAKTARIFAATANPSWRVTALKELDIDASEYSTTIYDGGYSIQFHGGHS